VREKGGMKRKKNGKKKALARANWEREVERKTKDRKALQMHS